MIVYVLQEEGFASTNDMDFVAVYESVEACHKHRPDIEWINEHQGFSRDSHIEYSLDAVEVITLAQ